MTETPALPPTERIDGVAHWAANALAALEGRSQAVEAEMQLRLEAVESLALPPRPLLDSDRLTVARVRQKDGATSSHVDRRDSRPERPKIGNNVFRALQNQNWSLDRVARRATGAQQAEQRY